LAATSFGACRDRRALANRYGELLRDVATTPHEPYWARSNWQSYCVRLPADRDQRAVIQELLDQGVASRRGIMCTHRGAPWAASLPRHGLAKSELAQNECILLLLYAQMSEDDQDKVGENLRRALDSVASRVGIVA
jgi:dTDP-4-amino-4,6-dideoxygalactose transaminase